MSHVGSPSPITHVSLCAGYGGIDLGLKRAIPSLRTIAFSEIEAFACANLVAKMESGLLDPAPIWTDLKTFPWADFHGCVDILSGGYPCQPFSAAGKRLGAEDPRHLWPHISAGIALMRPSCCFFENVEGHISLGLPDVIEDLAGLGYRTTWGIFSASEVGAPHQRKRVFILAYDGHNAGSHFWSRFIDHRRGIEAANIPPQASDQQAWGDGCEGWRQDTSSNAGISGCWSAELADSQRAGLEGQHHWHTSTEQAEYVGADAWASGECGAWPSRDGELANGQHEHDSWLQREGELREQQEGGPCGQRVVATGDQAWPSRPGEQQFWWEPPRVVVANAERSSSERRRDAGKLGGSQAEELGEALQRQRNGNAADDCGAAMGHPNSPRPQERSRQQRAGLQGADADGGEAADRQTQPSLGRDADGPADWLDAPELFVTCDNRTDELRLLGNGVVPATAERAFRTLVSELADS